MKTALCIVLALAATIATTIATADETASNEQAKAEQLRQDLHRMRIAIEQEKAQVDHAARNNSLGVQVSTVDAPGIGLMKTQLSQSMEKLQNRCLGLEAKAVNGNVIVICGNNSGTAENSNVRNGDDNTIIVTPPASQNENQNRKPEKQAQETSHENQ